MKIETERLELVAGNLLLAQADLEDRAKFSQLLEAQVPEAWPPPLNDQASQRYLANFFVEDPNAIGWGVWYYLLRVPKRVLIGNGGFKGKPKPDGSVEVGYSILDEYQNAGFGTEALRALTLWAFSHQEVKRIIAETFPDLKPSIRILEKMGFKESVPEVRTGQFDLH
jgi:RimJ/RimL family protein N-acetyltransferase